MVLFTALTGLAGWLFVALAASEISGKYAPARRVSAVLGLVVLVVGGFASVLHLSHPENILGALEHPSSGIFVEAALVGITALFAIAYLVLCFRDSSASARKTTAVLAGVAGGLLSFMAGASYMMGSIPLWNTPLLPLGYLATALAMGFSAFLAVVSFTCKEEDVASFGKIALVAAIAGVVMPAVYALVFPAVAQLATSWVAAMVLAGAVAAVSCALAAWKRAKAFAVLALALAVLSGVAFRCAMWVSMDPVVAFFNAL